ncbi:MAG: branched-chain amino acid aminotransferase [Pseudomonadota bacterium]
MASNESIWTYYQGTWHAGNTPILSAADHGAWLGSMVFDGARLFDGVTPDLDKHCARVNNSAEALGMTPTVSVEQMLEITLEGLANYANGAAVYIRPMYWPKLRGAGFITPDPESTDFCICLETVPMSKPTDTGTLATTSFRRPTLDCATVDAKASCLYPNNARMMREAVSKGFTNALVADFEGNVAETATSNIFMAKDGEIFTPVPNGCFLNGITRQRFIELFKDAGETVHEKTLTFDDFKNADEIFMTGNLSKVMPVVALDDKKFESGPVAKKAREMYWDWAFSSSSF